MASELPATLFAKSRTKAGTLTLAEHLVDTEHAAQLLFLNDLRAAKNFIHFFGLLPATAEKFAPTLRVACLAHDLGKANEHFFSMVDHRATSQWMRHEHLSTAYLCRAEVREWLTKSNVIDFDAVCGAVLSHHVKASVNDERHPWKALYEASGAPPKLWFQHPEVRTTLTRIAEVLGQTELPPTPESDFTKQNGWQTAINTGREAAQLFARMVVRDADGADATSAPEQRLRLLLATKIALIAADSLASARFRVGFSMEDWLLGTLHLPDLQSTDVWAKVILPRTTDVCKRLGTEEFPWSDFQTEMDDAPSRVVLKASCGSGKTLAAWRWIAHQCDKRAVGRVIFLYPTRGTATEGFKDYVGWAPEAEATLLHASSQYELEEMQENPGEIAALRGKHRIAPDEAEARLFALGLWSKRYFSATVDQFIGFMEHQYKSLCLVPILADSVVVLDEIHSYDERLFGLVKSMLKRFDVPVLAMSATLQTMRQSELESAGRCAPFPKDKQQVLDLRKKEDHPRYVLHTCSRDEAIEKALAALKDKLTQSKVLFVVNTVARCQALVRHFKEQLGPDGKVLCYHSRFKLGDRKAAHEKVIAEFQGAAGSVIAVTTQVCEMSLDLDADVLCTELCPASSLVQRMGRANRHAKIAHFRADVYVFEPEKDVPYERDDMVKARGLVHALRDKELSQSALATELPKFTTAQQTSLDFAGFLNSGWYALPGEVRDIDEHTRPCILDAEVEEVLRRVKAKRSIDDLIVPVPEKQTKELEAALKLPKHLRKAAAAQYTSELGFEATTASGGIS
jgi:CRISPR-associated endonuclease/helicase Cas3